MDFAIPADYRVELKESEKRDKFLDPASELKKQWNMNLMVIPTGVAALGTIPKR